MMTILRKSITIKELLIVLCTAGPALSGSLVQGIGFRAMMIGIAVICFLYGPLLYFLKDPKPRTEQEKQETSVSKALLRIYYLVY